MMGHGATLNGLVHLSALVCLSWQINSANMPAKKRKLTLFLLAYFIFLRRGERERERERERAVPTFYQLVFFHFYYCSTLNKLQGYGY